MLTLQSIMLELSTAIEPRKKERRKKHKIKGELSTFFSNPFCIFAYCFVFRFTFLSPFDAMKKLRWLGVKGKKVNIVNKRQQSGKRRKNRCEWKKLPNFTFMTTFIQCGVCPAIVYGNNAQFKSRVDGVREPTNKWTTTVSGGNESDKSCSCKFGRIHFYARQFIGFLGFSVNLFEKNLNNKITQLIVCLPVRECSKH